MSPTSTSTSTSTLVGPDLLEALVRGEVDPTSLDELEALDESWTWQVCLLDVNGLRTLEPKPLPNPPFPPDLKVLWVCDVTTSVAGMEVHNGPMIEETRSWPVVHLVPHDTFELTINLTDEGRWNDS